MGAAIGSMLGFAAGVAVSPFSIVAIILLLATPHAPTAGSRLVTLPRRGVRLFGENTDVVFA